MKLSLQHLGKKTLYFHSPFVKVKIFGTLCSRCTFLHFIHIYSVDLTLILTNVFCQNLVFAEFRKCEIFRLICFLICQILCYACNTEQIFLSHTNLLLQFSAFRKKSELKKNICHNKCHIFI